MQKKKSILTIFLIGSAKLMLSQTTGQMTGIYNTVDQWLGWGLALAMLICLGLAGFSFIIAENGASQGKKYLFGAVGCGIIWALRSTIIKALIG